jgi:hypothetical protein
MLFHRGREQPTAPNAGILRLEPGAHHPVPGGLIWRSGRRWPKSATIFEAAGSALPGTLQECLLVSVTRRNVSGFISAGPTIFWDIEKK